MKERIIFIINFPRIVIAWWLAKCNRDIVKEDIDFWIECEHLENISQFGAFGKFLIESPAFRNIVLYRIADKTNFLVRKIFKLLFRPLDSLFIFAREIGPGLYIQHGFSTIINAKSIGSRCWFNQQVTVGFDIESDAPVIGNGVRVTAGAKIIGDVIVGDNAIIGANAVVVKNVEECQVVGGIPAKYISDNVSHRLYVVVD